MQNYLTLLASITGLFIVHPAMASPSPSISLWTEASALVRRCASQTICVRKDGTRLASALKSVCPDLVVEGSSARFSLHGKNYVASITESVDSDGGDLNDLVLADSEGRVSEKHHNILGFDDVLLTLLGGNTETIRTTYQKCSQDE